MSSTPLAPVDPTPSREHQLVTPGGQVETWLWAGHGTWHGPCNKPPTEWFSMSGWHAALNGYKLAQGFTPPSDPKPAESASPPPVDELLPEDAGKRAVYWLWNGDRKTRWLWDHEEVLWTEYGRLPAATMAPREAWGRGFRMSPALEPRPETICQDAPPPERPPLYRMRAEGLTLEEYINTRRNLVRDMRKAADEKARSVRQALECADAIEAEILALSASLVRANPGEIA